MHSHEGKRFPSFHSIDFVCFVIVYKVFCNITLDISRRPVHLFTSHLPVVSFYQYYTQYSFHPMAAFPHNHRKYTPHTHTKTKKKQKMVSGERELNSIAISIVNPMK